MALSSTAAERDLSALDDRPWYKKRPAAGATALGVLMAGCALHLGGAAAAAVPLWTTVALLILAFVGVDFGRERKSPIVWAAMLFIGVTALQLIPLPPAILQLIDARSAECSALALAPFRVDLAGKWRPLHVDPGNGWSDLQYIVGLLAAYLAARQVTVRGEGERLVRAAALIIVAIACIGFFHKGAQLDRVFGFYAPRDTSAPPLLTPIINQNHLSAYLGAGVLLWLSFFSHDLAIVTKVSSLAAAMVCALGCVVSFSRAGIASTFGATLMFLAWVTWRARPRRRGVSSEAHARRAMITAVAAGSVVAIGLYVGWEALRTEQIRNDFTKITYIRAALRVVGAHPVLGIGSGATYAAITAQGVMPDAFTAERAESLPVDLALAVGPLAALAIMALGLRWLWTIRPKRKAPTWILGAFCVVVATLLHDGLDFSLWLGATGYLVAVLGGVLSGEALRGETSSHSTVVRVPVLALALCSALVAKTTMQSQVFVDRENVRNLVTNANRAAPMWGQIEAVLRRHPADAYVSLLSARYAIRMRDGRALRFVNQAMRLAPRWPAPHTLLAQIFVATGHRSQALLEANLAVRESDDAIAPMATLLARINATEPELDQAIPQGPRGSALMRSLATMESMTVMVDAIALRRDPHNTDALLRVARRAEIAGSTAVAQQSYETIHAAHPENKDAARYLATILIAANRLQEADRVVSRTLETTHDPALYELRARIQMQRGDPVGMRVTMRQWLDQISEDFDQRAVVLGRLGELELELRNYGSAISAFEQADMTAGGEHLYVDRIVVAARVGGDLSRLRNACATLREITNADDPRRNLCREGYDVDRDAGP